MSKLAWRTVTHADLAQLLNGAVLGESCAVGLSTVYRFRQDGREVLAVSLPDGLAVLVEPSVVPRPKRRRIDPGAPI